MNRSEPDWLEYPRYLIRQATTFLKRKGYADYDVYELAQALPQDNPTGPSDSGNKVVRGGAYYESSHRARIGERGREFPGSRGGIDIIGFRLVRSQ